MTQVLASREVAALYQRERMRLGDPRYAWIDTLFALPEAVMYVRLVEFFEGWAGDRPPYPQLWRDIRECIDLAHRDGSIKSLVAADLPHFIERDPALAEALHRFRSSGKRLFLLTNSDWAYTDPVMTYLLGGALPAYPSWRNFFDVIVVSGTKPAFFTEERPFVELVPTASRWTAPATAAPSSAGGCTRAATCASSRSGPRPAAPMCCTSATTSTATCCAPANRRPGAPPWCCRSWRTRSRSTTASPRSWCAWTTWNGSCATWTPRSATSSWCSALCSGGICSRSTTGKNWLTATWKRPSARSRRHSIACGPS